jgi:hypothetical protein
MKKSYLTFKKVFLSIKNNFTVLFSRIFTRANLNKAIIIFIVGLITRILIGLNYNVNVFSDYFNSISITYYISFSFFIVLVHEIVPYFDIDIIPSHFTNLYSIIRNNIVYTYNNICYINKFIFSLKLDDFRISSIKRTIIAIIDEKFTIKLPLYNINEDKTSVSEHKASSNKPMSNILNMDGVSDNDDQQSIIIGFNGSESNIPDPQSTTEYYYDQDFEDQNIRINYGHNFQEYVELNTNAPLFDGNDPDGFTTPSTMTPLFNDSRPSSINTPPQSSQQTGFMGMINKQFNFPSRPKNLLTANEIHRSNNLPRVVSTTVNVSSEVNEVNNYGYSYPVPASAPYFNPSITPSINESINSNHATMGLNSSNENMLNSREGSID